MLERRETFEAREKQLETLRAEVLELEEKIARKREERRQASGALEGMGEEISRLESEILAHQEQIEEY